MRFDRKQIAQLDEVLLCLFTRTFQREIRPAKIMDTVGKPQHYCSNQINHSLRIVRNSWRFSIPAPHSSTLFIDRSYRKV